MRLQLKIHQKVPLKIYFYYIDIEKMDELSIILTIHIFWPANHRDHLVDLHRCRALAGWHSPATSMPKILRYPKYV
jgi:hypothetical protein